MRLACLAPFAALVLALAAAPAALAEAPFARSEERAACAAHDALRRPFFGDTHVHTAFSLDANLGGTRNTPRDAYRFARGEEVGLQPYDESGRPQRSAKLRRPLDWTAISDHAETLAEVRICTAEGTPGYDSDMCWVYRNPQVRALATPLFLVRLIPGREAFHQLCGEGDRGCIEQRGVVWREIQAAAEEAYDRSPACRFTSFVGYEWTGTIGAGGNLHHNVIFRNANVPALPISFQEQGSAMGLWQALQKECVEGTPGCDAVTIPHNSNLSGPGYMFESARITGPEGVGTKIDAEEARWRQRWTPLIEVSQHKGDSECLLGGETTDEACGFEKLTYNSFSGVGRFRGLQLGSDLAPTQKAMVRDSLKKGLATAREVGVNPMKYGLIGSTDTHLGTPGMSEESEPKGHGGAGIMGQVVGFPDDLEFNPGGLAVLWAEENSRDSLFAAMQRREAYGTSGTRPVVRFFGGWNYGAELCSDPELVAKGYQGGVPMGGDLAKRPRGARAPTFVVSALQDAGSAGEPGTPLQRVQIVKGWVDAKGAVHERVTDVAGGPNDASVDLATCEPRGAGHKQLCSVWSDPAFDPKQRAFYYARVLENPTCRWSQHVCVANAVDCSDPKSVPPALAACCTGELKPTIQERAWTSPIWWEPGR